MESWWRHEFSVVLKVIRPKYTAAIHISTHRYVGLNLPAYIFLHVVWDCVSETRGGSDV